MQQIYRRTPVPKYDFNKVALATASDRPIYSKLNYAEIIWKMLPGRFTEIMEGFVSFLILHNLI